jgi:hypothetical protein
LTTILLINKWLAVAEENFLLAIVKVARKTVAMGKGYVDLDAQIL